MKQRPATLLLLATICFLSACGVRESPPVPTPAASGLSSGEGYVDVTGGKVWYDVAGSGTATPLLLLHGGPGSTSYYMEPLRRLADERPVIFYDQLGCGRSDRPEDTTLWRTERFVEELAELRSALNLEKVHILGHSWGTMLVVEYLLTRQPTGVESLILASPSISTPRYIEEARRLVRTLPAEIQETIERHEREGTTHSEEYRAAATEFLRRYFYRLDPLPPELEKAREGFGRDVYLAMWGPSEFHATGELKDFDPTDRLGEIQIPTLFTAGRYDESTPEATAWYHSLMPGSEIRIFENSSHMSMLEEPDLYIEVVRDFLRRVDAGL